MVILISYIKITDLFMILDLGMSNLLNLVRIFKINYLKSSTKLALLCQRYMKTLYTCLFGVSFLQPSKATRIVNVVILLMY